MTTISFLFILSLGYTQTPLAKAKNGFYLSPGSNQKSILVYKAVGKDTLVFVKVMSVPDRLSDPYYYKQVLFRGEDSFVISSKAVKVELLKNKAYLLVGPYKRSTYLETGYHIDWKEMEFKVYKLDRVYIEDKDDSSFAKAWGPKLYFDILKLLLLMALLNAVMYGLIEKVPYIIRNIISTVLIICICSMTHTTGRWFFSISEMQSIIISGAIASIFCYLIGVGMNKARKIET